MGTFVLRSVFKVSSFVFLVVMSVGCGDSTGSDADGSGSTASSSASTSSASGSGSGSGSSSSGGGACGTDFTHCSAGLFHCTNPGVSFFTCAEYSGADASSFQSICQNGGGTWAAGCCDEAGAVGQCLPATACMGMGIGFEYADAAGAQDSCQSTGGTWVAAP